MRTFLHKLMVDLTRHPREIVDFVPSSSWVCTTFRAYEHAFGRRAGVRFEGTVTPEGLTIHGTWEHFLAHQEGRLRAFKNPFAFKLVPLPVLITPDGQRFQTSIFNFAIAYDNSAQSAQSGPFTQQSMSYTVTGSNPLVFGWSGGSTGGASDITGMTYNSVAMSFAKNVLVPSDRWWDCYLLPGCATGSNTIASNSSSADLYWIGASSYSGTKQTGQPDASNNATQSGGSSISGTVTVVAANCWICSFASTRGTAVTAINVGSIRQTPGAIFIGDTNGTVSTGSNTVTLTVNLTGGSAGMVMVSIAPVAAATVNSGMFLVF